MNKSKLVIIYVLSIVIAFAAGTLYGFKEGAWNVSTLEQVAQGALSRYQLLSLDNGKTGNVRHHFELNIDSAIHRYALYKENGNKLLSELFLDGYVDNIERYVDDLATYRTSHPIVFNSKWALPNESDDDETKAFKQKGFRDSEEMLSIIRDTLRERNVPESALINNSE